MFPDTVDEDELMRLLQDEAMKLPDMNIAISGIAGRFPKASSVSELEEGLFEGLDLITDNDDTRFAPGLWGLPNRAGRLKDLSRFDCEFFNFTADEANQMDFQLRILYEVVYEAILDAGVNPADLRGSKTGVFLGLHCSEFESAMAEDPSMKGVGYFAQHASKIAQYFDFRGITCTYDAACASGFVGMDAAVHALHNKQIEQAIVCSSTIPINPTVNFAFHQLQMLSPNGYSRFLDSQADGYVKSEACVALLLQQKHLAHRNYSSVMASLSSVDGFKREGITFPSATGQACLMRETNKMAGITTNQIEYIEAHGTGTPAGDPQEAQAIASVYFSYNQQQEESQTAKEERQGEKDTEMGKVYERKIGPLLIGSSKTNMGHSEGASGLCALTKVALMLDNEIIYKCLHFDKPNSYIQPLVEGKLKVVEETTKLRSKIIPISCYGFGGCNVHAIMRANERPAIEYGEHLSKNDDLEPRLVVMFGRSESSINAFFDSMLDEKARNTKNCLTDDFFALVDSLSMGKIDRLMNHRGYLIVDRRASSEKRELRREIKLCKLEQEELLGPNLDQQRPLHVQESKQRLCNLILPGLGSQWPGMAAGLCDYKPFWSTVERLAQVLTPFEDHVNLIKLLTEATEDDLNQSMASLFVSIVGYQIALINLVRDQVELNGLVNVVGHSLGEVACAYAVGLIDEREAVLVAYELGKTLDECKERIKGKMVALSMGEDEVIKLISSFKTLRVSCVNGPSSVTISGTQDEVDSFCNSLKADSGIRMIPIKNCSIALHNDAIMTPDIKKLLQTSVAQVLAARTNYDCELKSSWISSVSGVQESSTLKKANAEYFAECLCRKVDFYGALKKLSDDSIALELGPSGIFESQLRQVQRLDESTNPEHVNKFHYVKLMRQSCPKQQQVLDLISGLGSLYLAGSTFKRLTHFHQRANDDQGVELFPVRRQTPSLSSIFRWNHDQSLFVPRYPAQFSKSSAKTEMPVDIIQDRDKYIAGHCIEGRILYPATGYLFLIWRVFSFTQRKIYDACFQDVERELVPIEFHNVKLLRAVLLGTRATQIYVHLEEGTGKFQIKEGGSIVVEGYAKSPQEKPNGLLYDHIRDQIKEEKLELELDKKDIYKQFRVSGYDYGETFQNIEACSADGRFCKVNYNGHFVAFTDSILQSIFLAITQYTPSGGLFLPTRFDYVRFQPEIILQKLRESKKVFDLSDGSLNTKEKRKIMAQIMEREGDVVEGNPSAPTEESSQEEQANEAEPTERCIFEAFCDPITGIIITDGIEMRGIKATPAPRRLDNNEVLLESYQFVKDIEDPVEDENLTKLENSRSYVQICNSMSVNLLGRLCGRTYTQLNGLRYDLEEHVADLEQNEEQHVKKYLTSIYYPGESKEDYDIKKNADHTLMSVLDQLLKVNNHEAMKNIFTNNRIHLRRDIINQTFMSERVARSLLEMVVENICLKSLKLRLMEINTDDGLFYETVTSSLKRIEPSLSIDYLLAHPNIERLKSNKLLIEGGENQPKSHKLSGLSSLFGDRHLRELSFIIYKDVSCYSVRSQSGSVENGVPFIVGSLSKALAPGGFVLIALRQQMTLAERIVLTIDEQNLLEHKEELLKKRMHSIVEELNLANERLKVRYQSFIEEARRANLVFASMKSGSNGCTMLLFRRKKEGIVNGVVMKEERVLVRVRHDNRESVARWLEMLKENFGKEKSSAIKEGEGEEEDASEDKASEQMRVVWLCAVETREQQVSGLVGMMQALRKELGSLRLRCFYDCHTFKDSAEPIGVEQIEKSANFRLALERDFIWNCVDSCGNYGSFRHFTLDNYFNNDLCLCSKQSIKDEQLVESTNLSEYAYIKNATNGDLSSFTWFEAPFKFLEAKERKDLVKVAYSALNFRDIMLASGKLPLDAIPIQLVMNDCLLGLEFSGYDSTGKRVMGMVPGQGIATHILCSGDSSIKLDVPDWMSLKEAATIPIVYATAAMALINRGKMQAGETILIHAGSGGVGQAAIRLAAYYGLTIYTTVGTDEKRKFLLEEFPNCLTNDRIFSSRDCKFEEEIMQATRGRGVDLVLNSLADDKLHASVRCLADGGRFLEIGKYDLAFDTKLELLRLDTNKTFHGILLDKLFDTDTRASFKESMRKTFEFLRQGLEKGIVRPIKYTLFKKNQVEDAFRFMATGKHMGKILIEINDEKVEIKNNSAVSCVPKFQASKDKSYIITGGLGGFGLELTKWLVNQGARNILFTSREGVKTGYQRTTLARLEANNGLKFLVVDNKMADTTTLKGVRKLCKLAIDMSPTHEIGGIFHLAMVLKDTLIENMSAEDFEMVYRPKVETFLHLDRITRELNLQVDYFVGFSSITSGKGNAGQANYAYANSCLERICERRRQFGHHALAIQWGAIGDVGVAYENLGGNDVVIGGTIPQRLPSCFSVLNKLLCSPFSVCLSVLPSKKATDGVGQGNRDLVGPIMHVLGIKNPSKVSDTSTLGELGLDSLMAVEIRQYIEREYDMTLNIQEIRSLTIAKIKEINEQGKPTGKNRIEEKVESQVKHVDNYGAQKNLSNTEQNPKVLMV